MIIIGAGGIGSFLASALSRITHDITIIDGDIVEAKNLSRQLYETPDIGKYKAEVLAAKLFIQAQAQYFATHIVVPEGEPVFCCADNMPCRKDVLDAADRFQCPAIIGANETWRSEAYIYLPDWKDTKFDPRTYYPQILTENAGRPDAPCHADATLKDNPQTLTANFTAAAFMLRLYFIWLVRVKGKKVNTTAMRPVHILSDKLVMFNVLEKKGQH
jgi:molybdopterin/thiamine biosynthesis adenylyltransferase